MMAASTNAMMLSHDRSPRLMAITPVDSAASAKRKDDEDQ